MVCAVSLHYPYKIHEVLKLTFKQLDVMFRTLMKETQEKINIQAAMFGCEMKDEKKKDDDYESYDTTKLDENARNFDELMKCPKQP